MFLHHSRRNLHNRQDELQGSVLDFRLGILILHDATTEFQEIWEDLLEQLCMYFSEFDDVRKDISGLILEFSLLNERNQELKKLSD